jgi:YceI-like domain
MKQLCIGLFLFALLLSAQAQESYRIIEGTSCYIDGTSTLSDWIVTVKQIEGEVSLSKDFAQKGLPKPGALIPKVLIRMVVKSMDGGRGAVMNDKILGAFNEPANPYVVFEMTEGKITNIKDEAAGTFNVHLKGKISMAGQSRVVEMDIEGKRVSPGVYSFAATYPVKMTDYGITPPSAMFGQIESGDEVKVRFNITVSK